MTLSLRLVFCLTTCLTALACSATVSPLPVKGQWLRHADAVIFEDPQPSGLTVWREQLVTLSDRSAAPEQQLKLHIIEPDSARIRTSLPILLSPSLAASCFAPYLTSAPDLEALVADRWDDRVLYTVTEDAAGLQLSAACQSRFGDSGAADYPFLLVRLEYQDSGHMLMTGVRPLRFAEHMALGNFPNDGIEGMAMGKDSTLYLGLEKDAASQPRIFRINLSENVWAQDDFIDVQDAKLPLPAFGEGAHPINALEYLDEDDGYLLAFARNDDQLWLVDVSGQRPTKIIPMDFLAQAYDASCPAFELMDNASIEGITVMNGQLWLVNDPWKVNYLKNIGCPANALPYQKMGALLFRLPLAQLTGKGAF